MGPDHKLKIAAPTMEQEHQEDNENEALSSIDMEDVMESMTRITFCGLGGTIIGLSLEKRLESLKITTAASVAAAARRKRGKILSSHQATIPLSVTWAISCMVFCSIIEVSRLSSPSTWILKQLQSTNKTQLGFPEFNLSNRSRETAISVADHSFGGAVAGVVCSFGRRMYSQTSVAKIYSPRRFSGLVPGLAIGFVAGTIQSAIEYGTHSLKESRAID